MLHCTLRLVLLLASCANHPEADVADAVALLQSLASSRSKVVEAPTLLPRFASQNLKSGHEMEDIYVGLEALLAVPFALGLAARTADCTPRKPIHYRCKTSSRAGSLPSLGKHVYVAKNDLAACATWCRATFGTAFRGYATIDPQSNNANLCKCISALAGDALVAQCVAGGDASYYTAALRPSRSVFEIVHLGDSDCPEQSRSNELRLLRREVVREASLRPDAHAPLLDPARFNLKQCCAGFSIVVDQTRRVQLDDGTSCEYWDMLGGNFAQKINGAKVNFIDAFDRTSPFTHVRLRDGAQPCLRIFDALPAKVGGSFDILPWLRSTKRWWERTDGDDAQRSAQHQRQQQRPVVRVDHTTTTTSGAATYGGRNHIVVDVYDPTSGWGVDLNHLDTAKPEQSISASFRSDSAIVIKSASSRIRYVAVGGEKKDRNNIRVGYRPHFDIAIPLASDQSPIASSIRSGIATLASRTITAFFRGSDHNNVRKALLALHNDQRGFVFINQEGFVRASSSSSRSTRSLHTYTASLAMTRFGVVPEGNGLHSYRLSEVMQFGCVPVILTEEEDTFVPPFSDTLNWRSFAFQFSMNDVKSAKVSDAGGDASLVRTLSSVSDSEWIAMQRRSVAVWSHFFRPENVMAATSVILRSRIQAALTASSSKGGDDVCGWRKAREEKKK